MTKTKKKSNPKPLSAKLVSWWHPILNGSTEAFCLEDAGEEFLQEFMELIGNLGCHRIKNFV